MAVQELKEWELMPSLETGVIVVGKTMNGVNVFSSYIESYAVEDDVLRVSTLAHGYVLRLDRAKNLLPSGGDHASLMAPLREYRIQNIRDKHVLSGLILRPEKG